VGQPVAGLVGQVAGQPVYAHRVLEGLENQLRSLSRQSPPVFRRQARELILARIQSLVQDRLYLDEAKGALTPAERANLDRFVDLQRQDLVRRHGRGSEALADQTLRAATGRTLEERLRDERDGLIVSTYRSRTIEPLVNVTRRDVERYYRDNIEAFNPPDQRTVRSIYTVRAADVQEIARRLNAGEDFVTVADDPLNQNPGGAATTTFAGDDAFGDAIAPTLVGLTQGAWAGPVREPVRGREYFIYLEKIERGDRRSLEDAQLEIERLRQGAPQRERDRGAPHDRRGVGNRAVSFCGGQLAGGVVAPRRPTPAGPAARGRTRGAGAPWRAARAPCEPGEAQGAVVVVEVKSGTRNDRYPPELHVNAAKQRRLVSLGAQAMRRYRLQGQRFRFDVVAVVFDHADDPDPEIRHHVGAFASHV